MDIDKASVEIGDSSAQVTGVKHSDQKEQRSESKKKDSQRSEGPVRKVIAEHDIDECQKALDMLKESNFEDRNETKKCFDAIYRIFNRFKQDQVVSSSSEDPDKVLKPYLILTIDIIEYIQSPQYNNFFKEFDKKLTKNILKRCIVEPFADRIMKKSIHETESNKEAFSLWKEGKGPNPQTLNLPESYEIELYERDDEEIGLLNTMLKELLKIDKLISNSLKDWLSTPLMAYISYVKNSQYLKIKFQQDVLILEQFARKCQLLDDVFDYYNKDQIFNFFKNKQPHNIERYVKVLTGFATKCIMENKSFNKKYIKQVFGGESQTCMTILKDNLSWLLLKYKYDFSEEQVIKILSLIQDYHELFVKPNNPQLKVKLDSQLQQFLAEQSPRFPEMNLSQTYSNTFYSTDEQLQNKEIIIKQIALSKEKAQAANTKQKTIKENLNQSDYPAKISDYFDSVLEKFQNVQQNDYKKLDKEIGDVLHQVYRERFGGTSNIASEIFKILDKELGSKKSLNEAKNYKKLLAAIQKSKLLHPNEVTALFAKANRFLTKDSVKKEKDKIKKEVKEQVMIDGIEPKEEVKELIKPSQPQEQEEIKVTQSVIDEEKTPPPAQTEAQTKLEKQNQTKLEKYRQQIQAEQEKRFMNVMEMHSQMAIDFSSDKAQTKLRHIEELIKEVYKNQQVSKKDLEIRDQVINRIKEAFFKASHKDYPIKITGEILISGFGSCHNGSWNTEKSDIDVTAVFFDSLTHNHHQLIKMCSKIISKVAKPGTLIYVPASRVPILKFFDDVSGIQVDFNVNNLLGITNSNLIFTYTQIDQRFHIMNVFLKWWAKSVGIIGAAYGYLSSYALTLMIIAFLQNTEPPVLPCLQERLLRDQRQQTVYYPVSIEELDSKRRRHNYSTKDINKKVYCMYETDAFFEKDLKVIQQFYMPKEENTKSVAQLIYEFFYFYVYEFDSANMVINIKEAGSDSVQRKCKNGQVIRGGAGFSQKFHKDRFPFSIVDPFEVQRNPGCSVKFHSNAHKKIIAQFRAALDKFNVNTDNKSNQESGTKSSEYDEARYESIPGDSPIKNKSPISHD